MKKFISNKIIFICISIMIVLGWFSRPLAAKLFNAVVDFGESRDINEFIDDVDLGLNNISYKSALLDLNSIIYRLTDTKNVKKEDQTILRLDNDYLYFKQEIVPDEYVKLAADSCISFKQKADELEIPFLYVYAPRKFCLDDVYHAEFNKGVDKFLNLIENGGVPLLNLAEKMEEQNMTLEESYFITDHHWTPETGLWATGEILKKMKELYGYEYDESFTLIDNYNVKVYEDYFLGAQGKMVGRFYSPLGVDDFSLITPKFKTDLTVSHKDIVKKGEFHETVLDLSNIEKKDFYGKNCYVTYTGGDFPEQKIENNLIDDGKKVLFLKDSFACAVTPFLSLNTDKLSILDIRIGLRGEGYIESVYDYIDEFKPDYIIVLYSGLEIFDWNTDKYTFE